MGSKVMGVLADVAQTQVKKAGKFVIPGVCMVKTRVKPATKAGKKLMFGKEVCQGKARQDCGQGLCGRRAQEVNLSPTPSVGDPLPRGPATGWRRSLASRGARVRSELLYTQP